MSDIEYIIFVSIMLFCVLPLYLLFGIGLLLYFNDHKNNQQRWIAALAVFVSPFGVPFAVLFFLGRFVIKLVVTIASIFCMALGYVLYWIVIHLPNVLVFGRLFRFIEHLIEKIVDYSQTIFRSWIKIIPVDDAKSASNRQS
jgi:hypothetical protein